MLSTEANVFFMVCGLVMTSGWRIAPPDQPANKTGSLLNAGLGMPVDAWSILGGGGCAKFITQLGGPGLRGADGGHKVAFEIGPFHG